MKLAYTQIEFGRVIHLYIPLQSNQKALILFVQAVAKFNLKILKNVQKNIDGQNYLKVQLKLSIPKHSEVVRHINNNLKTRR